MSFFSFYFQLLLFGCKIRILDVCNELSLGAKNTGFESFVCAFALDLGFRDHFVHYCILFLVKLSISIVLCNCEFECYVAYYALFNP